MSPEKLPGRYKFISHTDERGRHVLYSDGTLQGLLMGPGAVIGYRESMRKKESYETPSSSPKVVILGSFRFKPEIDALIDQLTESGIEVLAPPKGSVTAETENQYKILEGDLVEMDEALPELEGTFLNAVTRADALYVFDPGGYVGKDTRFEIVTGAYAGVPVFTLEPLRRRDKKTMKLNSHFKSYSPEELIRRLKSNELDTEGQAKYVPKNRRPQTRIFPFTDHTGRRAMFVDMTDW